MYKDQRGVVEDSFQAFLVEGASFTEKEEYPILESWMVSKVPPQKIMPFDKALNHRGDLSDVHVCTYARDRTFERIRRNPGKYLSFFRRCAGLIGFDFSVHSDMPAIKQKAQMNDSLSLTYYYGKVFAEFESKCKFYYYEPWICSDRRKRGGIQYGD